jgi:glycosyltransferase involved in cell wall biosynthesis
VRVATRPAEPETFRVAMVGRFSPWKGQVVALRAFAAADLGPGARLVLMGAPMFGEEHYEREIHREIESLGLAERVELPGFVDDVLAALTDVDVLVHASTIPEPFGQVVLEGLAAGVPVVATREGGPGEILADGVDGLLYPAGDAAALGRLLRDLRADPALRRRLTENGRKRVADFSPTAIGASVMQLYADIGTPEHKGEGTS